MGTNKLYAFQEDAVRILAKRRHTLLAHPPGLGKTCIAIELINRLRLRRVLIICKASIKANWQRKLNDWLDSARYIQIINKKTDAIEPLSEIVIVNYDLISHSYMFYQLAAMQWELMIADECHSLKNTKAQRTQSVLAAKGLVRHADRTLMITGTPVLNRPIELFPLLKVLSPETIAPYNDYYKYARRFCAGFQDNFSFNDKGASHTDDLNRRLRMGYMIRRTYNEVGMQLPKQRTEIVLVDQIDGVKTGLRILENAERTDFKHKKFSDEADSIATLRRETAEAKVDAMMDKIKEYVDGTDKIVIFAYHHSVISKLAKELSSFGVVTLTGNTPTSDRQNIIDAFVKDNAIKVFIGQIQAAGEGIDGLQAVCHDILFAENSWVPSEIAQAIARVWRLGQTQPVLVRFLVWTDSVESHMLRVALDKVKVIKEITK